MSALEKIEAARVRLLLDTPFFGVLSLRLKLVERNDLPTMAVDGVHLFYNADFTNSLPPAQLRGVVAHEVLHVANCHHVRRAGRSAKLWNIACDFAINGLLIADGFQLPPGRLHDRRYDGLSSETIYRMLIERAEETSGVVEGGADPGACGEVLDVPASDGGDKPSEADLSQAEAEVAVAVFQAAQASLIGGCKSAAAERLLAEQRQPIVDWREMLRDAVRGSDRSDYTWRLPSRRHIGRGLYLPSLATEAAGEIVVVVDSSGSVDDAQLTQYGAEISAILEDCAPARIHLLHCDAKLQRVEQLEPSDLPLRLTTIGGGGTDFRPPFEWVDGEDLDPTCLIYLTDLRCKRFPCIAPAYPVIWAATTDREPPFGEVVRISPGA